MSTRFEEIFAEIYAIIATGNREHREHSHDLDPLTMRFVFEAVCGEAVSRGWSAASKPREMPDDLHEIVVARRDSFSGCGVSAVLKIGRRPGVHLATFGIRFLDSSGWSRTAHTWTFDSLPSSMPLRLTGVGGGVDAAVGDEQRAFVASADAAIKKRTA